LASGGIGFFIFFGDRFLFDRAPERDVSRAISAFSFFSFFFKTLIVLSFLDIF